MKNKAALGQFLSLSAQPDTELSADDWKIISACLLPPLSNKFILSGEKERRPQNTPGAYIVRNASLSRA